MNKLTVKEKEYAVKRIEKLIKEAQRVSSLEEKALSDAQDKLYWIQHGYNGEAPRYPTKTVKVKPVKTIQKMVDQDLKKKKNPYYTIEDFCEVTVIDHPDVVKQKAVIEKLRGLADKAASIRNTRNEAISSLKQETLDALWLGDGITALENLKDALKEIK